MGQNSNYSGKIKEMIVLIMNFIAESLETIDINGQKCIVCPDGTIGRICTDGESVLWVEYADNIEMANNNIFPEDGDGFFLKKYRSNKDLAEAIIHEIKK